MKKSDLLIVGALMVLLVMWPRISRMISGEPPPAPPPATTPAPGTDPAPGTPGVTNTPPSISNPLAPSNQAVRVVSTNTPPVATGGVAAVAQGTPAPAFPPEDQLVLSNEVLRLTLTRRGACLLSADLLDYPAFNRLDSPPKRLSFTNRPALALEGLQGADVGTRFEADVSGGTSVVFRTALAPDLTLERRFTLGAGYQLRVKDLWRNGGGQSLQVPAHRVVVGRQLRSENAQGGKPNRYAQVIGIDAKFKSGGSVQHFNKTPLLPFTKPHIPSRMKELGTLSVDEDFKQPPNWAATKNRFFCSILTVHATSTTPDASGIWLHAEADADRHVREVESAINYGPITIANGRELLRDMEYFVGPKKFKDLHRMNLDQSRVMEFGRLTILCELILRGLNFFEGLVGNIGLAIILLTLTIKLIFFPLLKKSSGHFKRLQVLGPEMKEINEKYKDDPRKKQEKTLELYRKHGMSPLEPLKGCLPMVIQIPVFFSLFYVIRSAVELRYSNFLWVKDLSEQESLFMDAIGFPVNLLPLCMAGSSLVMQKMMQNPSMDKTQQRIMLMMPVVFLFFMYSFPAGLMLYWTTSNIFTIGQQWLVMRDRDDEAKNGGDTEAATEKPSRKAASGEKQGIKSVSGSRRKRKR